MEVLGIDIGGSALKGAIVDTHTGRFVTEKYRLETSQPASIKEVVSTFAKIVGHFGWKGPIGCGFPAVVQNGIIKTASNIDKGFMGINAIELFGNAVGEKIAILNDADAAGLAELKFGTVANFNGLAIFLTIGTGIGSAIFNKGELTPNTELGQIFLKNGLIAEKYASDAIRKKDDLDWDQWGKRFNEYLNYIDNLFYPELIIVGGGTSKKFDKFQHLLTLKTRVVPATLLNDAGIVGAALAAL